MRYTYFGIFLLLMNLGSYLYAQQNVVWEKVLKNEETSFFYDLFLDANNELYITGGRRTENVERIHISKLDATGDFVWRRDYNFNGQGYSIIKTEDSGQLVGARGRYANPGRYHFAVIKTDIDGNLEWENLYSLEYDNGSCLTVIETKGGNFLCAGRANESGFVVMLSPNGEVIWSLYEWEHIRSSFQSIRETEVGYFLCGYYSINADDHFWIIKVNYNGEIEYDRVHQRGIHSQAHSIIRTSDGNLVIAGGATSHFDEQNNRQYGFRILSIDLNCELQLDSYIQSPRNQQRQFGGIVEVHDGYILSGKWASTATNFKISYNGDLIWYQPYSEYQLPKFESVVSDIQGYLYVTGSDQFVGGFGYVAKLLPDASPPNIVDYFPKELNIKVLKDDTVDFWVSADDLQDDELSFEWFVDEQFVGSDSSKSITFPEFGEFQVKCVVKDDDFEVEILWNVAVVDFYISDFFPEERQVTVRRNQQTDFSVQVRAIQLQENNRVNYEWTVQQRPNGRIDLLDDSNFSTMFLSFPFSTEYAVTARAFRGASEDMHRWRVNVRSILASFYPREDYIRVPRGTEVDFLLTPVDENSDSVSFQWTINGTLLGDSEEFIYRFNDLGRYFVDGFIWDPIEADSQRWMIDVIDPNDVSDFGSVLPADFALHALHPNPFNSSTQIRFDVPTASEVKLSVFDMNGRLLTNLVNGNVSAGSHAITWDASGFATGIYFVKMETGNGVKFVRKAVMIN